MKTQEQASLDSANLPILSVIIVAYRSRDEIGGCLSSIPRAIEGRTVEVAVVDNSPGDGTGDRVSSEFPWVMYVSPETNLGFGKANNVGYAQTDARSEYVLFLNPDTVCNEPALTHCVARLRADPAIGLISPKLVLADCRMDLACRRSIPTLWDGFCRACGLAATFPRTALFSGYNLTHLPDSGTYEVGAINGAFMMGRRSVFEAVARAASPSAPPVEELKSKFKDEHKGDSAGLLRRSAKPDLLAMTSLEAAPPAYSLQPTAAKRSVAVFDDSFFMYGDDLDLCIRVSKSGWKIVYDGSVSITHLKGLSVAKDFSSMSEAIFDANRDVYLKHFNARNSAWVRWKYHFAFGLWKRVARWRARLRGHRRVQPV